MFGKLGKRTTLLVQEGIKVRRLLGRCRKLMSERGEAAGASLARETFELYDELDRNHQEAFFRALLRDFSPDPKKVLGAAQRYLETQSFESLIRLSEIAEPPRQELLRRLNRLPGGTGQIVRMRERLLDALKGNPELAAVDWDFHHLLSSWFNPGFLKVVRVDWQTPAALLEKIIQHEAVHEIQGWNDLHRRLERDRRCFAFFHPTLPEEPLIFVEVALVEDLPDAILPLIDIQSNSGDPARAGVAVFYSISNCQPGLRGVSLGNFLIKQVVDVLSAEFPRLKRFCTLSPVPGFAAWLSALEHETVARQSPNLLRAVLAVAKELGPDPGKAAADPAAAMKRLDPVKNELMALCASYLVRPGAGDAVTPDPVARFHLNNGARLERLNWGADLSKKGLRQSLGMMVNYVYERRAIERNHERFISGQVTASRQVRSLALGE